MKIRLTAGHPRLYITPKDLPRFKTLSLGPRKQYRDALLKWVEPITESLSALRDRIGTDCPEQQALALGQAWRLTKDPRYGRAARWLLESLEHCLETHRMGYDQWGLCAEAAGLLYDWLHDYWKQTGLEEVVARATVFCARRALDEALKFYIVDDWHNYYLGLLAGSVAGALAVGVDHPKFENGKLLRTLRALLFTGSRSDVLFLQDLYYLPRTVRCLQTALRAGNGAGFAGHWEATGAYHSVDALEFVKMADWWTSAVRGDGVVWPEVSRAGDSIMHFSRPGDERCIVHGDANPFRPHMRQAIIMAHLQARTPRKEFAAWLAQHPELIGQLTPMHALLRYQRPAKNSRPWSAGLPTAVLIDPLAVMRSSWKDDATLVTMRCGRHGGWHNHLDHNSFTIFRGGALAIDSGGIDYTGPHRPEYAIRTLAHNAILVRDPRESKWLGKFGKATNNDGGQRMVVNSYCPPNPFSGNPHAILTEERREKFADEFEMGHFAAFEPGERFDYVAGDATRAYTYPWSGLGDNQSRRVEEAVRQIVFLKSDIIVVFDRVEATRANFEKKWLLHSMGVPAFFAQGRARKAPVGIHSLPAAGPFEFPHERGRLTLWPLLPVNRSVRAIGGKGYECWVEHAIDSARGKNYPAPVAQRETGAWRIEISPKKKASRDCFLTVFHAGLARKPAVRNAINCQVREQKDIVELDIHQKSAVATLRFNTKGRIAVEIEYAGRKSRFSAPAPKRVSRASGAPA